MPGFKPLGTKPLGALPSKAGFAIGVFSSAGVGLLSAVGVSVFAGTVSVAGSGALAAVGRANSATVFTASGTNTCLMETGVPGVFRIAGVGGMTAAGYAFVPGGEIACVHAEYRYVSIQSEYRTAVVASENKAYTVGFEVRTPSTENRKRDC